MYIYFKELLKLHENFKCLAFKSIDLRITDMNHYVSNDSNSFKWPRIEINFVIALELNATFRPISPLSSHLIYWQTSDVSVRVIDDVICLNRAKKTETIVYVSACRDGLNCQQPSTRSPDLVKVFWTTSN